MQYAIEKISLAIQDLNEMEALSYLSDLFKNKTVFSSSFSWEDQVITFMIAKNNLPIDIFTLDTGRLFGETYYVWNRTNEMYKTKIKAYYPQHETLEKYIDENGPNAFYESVALRKQCCHIRKVEPLNRALHGKSLWITGLRAEHSPERNNLQQLEWDEVHQLYKFHPLLYWATDEVKKYIAENSIPYNTLHDKGFVSIGCAPCTRAIREGESFRSGRWWWEENSNKECGLHVAANH